MYQADKYLKNKLTKFVKLGSLYSLFGVVIYNNALRIINNARFTL